MDRYMILTHKEPPFSLLKKCDLGEFIWVNGRWNRTKVICDYMYGHNDWVDDITEQGAREMFPEAF